MTGTWEEGLDAARGLSVYPGSRTPQECVDTVLERVDRNLATSCLPGWAITEAALHFGVAREKVEYFYNERETDREVTD